MRDCDRCGHQMQSDVPRRRVAGLFVCSACADNSHTWADGVRAGFKRPFGITVHAHDMSQDPLVLRHCPFCGSGQVVARNDGSMVCEFCQTVCTVRIEPYYPSWPQTVNGVPQEVPLYPNTEDNPQNAVQSDPEASSGPSQGEDLIDPEDLSEDESEPSGGNEDDNPFSKRSFLTHEGDELPEDIYVRHLAIRFAQDHELDAILDSREW